MNQRDQNIGILSTLKVLKDEIIRIGLGAELELLYVELYLIVLFIVLEWCHGQSAESTQEGKRNHITTLQQSQH